MSDFLKFMKEAVDNIDVDGVIYVDLLKAGTANEKVAFKRRSNGDLFWESGEPITGKEAESINGKIELGFYIPKP